MNFSGRRWVTVNEVAEYLSMHPVTVRRKIDRGEIPSSRVGRSVRVDIQKLNEQLERSIDPSQRD